MCLQHDLREQGIDPDSLPRIADRSMARNYHALQAGDLDLMQAFEPFVSDGRAEQRRRRSLRGEPRVARPPIRPSSQPARPARNTATNSSR